MDEIARVRERYEHRKTSAPVQSHGTYFHYNYFTAVERELRFAEIVRKRFDDFGTRRVLEIGAGGGNNLLLFRRLGFRWENLYANELLEERVERLRYNLPGATVLPGDASELPFRAHFDIILQATVFTSLLDDGFKQKLAHKLLEMLNEHGIVLWYDFKYDNPRNSDVKGISRGEIRRLFDRAASIEFFSTTLAPPIGRRVGRAYGIVNTLAPFLRTHLVAVITGGSQAL
jgi:SAM-dependent methyltransferase